MTSLLSFFPRSVTFIWMASVLWLGMYFTNVAVGETHGVFPVIYIMSSMECFLFKSVDHNL